MKIEKKRYKDITDGKNEMTKLIIYFTQFDSFFSYRKEMKIIKLQCKRHCSNLLESRVLLPFDLNSFINSGTSLFTALMFFRVVFGEGVNVACARGVVSTLR